MHPLDVLLLEAWDRVASHIQRDRLRGRHDEATRRAFRRTQKHLSRPVRPWCLCIRACDTRLKSLAVIPKHAEELREPHEVILFSETFRRLCAPVQIPWPGIDWARAADMLGRSTTSLDRWIRRGILKCKKYNARSVGKSGPPVPYVWSPTPLDPNAIDLRAPHPAWGTLWQFHHRLVPDGLEIPVLRVPVFHTDRRGSRGGGKVPRLRGWLFRCPGLPARGTGFQPASPSPSPSSPSPDPTTHIIESNGVEYETDLPTTCGRLVRRLYVPLPIWTVADALDLPDPLAITFPLRAQQPSPPLSSSPSTNAQSPAPHAFPFLPACHRCHRILNVNLSRRQGWNEFIFHISGGLLYGHEVPRPDDIPAKKQTRPWGRHRTLLAEKHDDILAALAAGRSVTSIARDLGIPQSTLHDHVQRLQGKDPRARRRKRAVTPTPATSSHKQAS